MLPRRPYRPRSRRRNGGALRHAAAFVRAGAAECDAVRQLRLEKLPVAGLVGSRHDVAGGIAHRAQSRLRRMHATRWDTSRSDRQASAQAVQVSTQLKQASMQRLMASEWAGFSGCDRNMARTATADMDASFRPPSQTRPPQFGSECYKRPSQWANDRGIWQIIAMELL